MRIAWVSPLPPASSGIADYSADASAAHLADRHELELFYDGDRAPAAAIAERWRCRPVGELAAAAGRFDLVVYQIGNSAPHHAESFRLALELPGVVVLHEFMLHHLVRGLTLARGDAAGYLEEMRYAAGQQRRDGGAAPARHPLSRSTPGTFRSSSAWWIAAARSSCTTSSPASGCSPAGRSPGSESCRCRSTRELSSRRPPRSSARSRSRLGLDPDAFRRRLVRIRDAAQAPRGRAAGLRPPAREPARRPVRDRRRSARPTTTSPPRWPVSAPPACASSVAPTSRAFDDWMRACDVAVNLRHPDRRRDLGVVHPPARFRSPDDRQPDRRLRGGARRRLPAAAARRLRGVDPGRLSAGARRSATALAAAIGTQARAWAVARSQRGRGGGGLPGELLEQAAAAVAPPFVAVPPLAPYPASDPWPALLGGDRR